MTRSMGDATHDNVAALAAVQSSLQLVAGYVTGTADIQWTAADWAEFPGLPQVTIDQGAAGSPVATANVRDVEAGAWSAAGAVDQTGWTAPRPTIYCSLDSLPELEQAGWQGAVWVADYTGTAPGSPPAMPAGMTCVAVQYTDQGGGGTYDLSVVFDPYWPMEAASMPTIILAPTVAEGGSGNAYLLDGGKLHHIVDPTSLAAYQALPGIGTVSVTTAEETALLADFPPGNPAVTVNSTVPTFSITGAAVPEAT